MKQIIVKIIPSPELLEMKLKSLVGRTGIITAYGRKSGCWVALDKPYQDEKEWFIPSQSLQITG